MQIYKKEDLKVEDLNKLNELFPERYKNSFLEVSPTSLKTALEKFDGSRGLFIHGECGTGKTYNLVSIAKNINIHLAKNEYEKRKSEKPDEEHNLSFYKRFPFWNSTELSAVFRNENIRRKDKDETLDELIRLSKWKTIFLDDFCAEKYSEFLEECFYRIVNTMWESNNNKLFITSNYSLQQISERIGDRIASRIAGMCDVVKLGGNDKRLNNN